MSSLEKKKLLQIYLSWTAEAVFNHCDTTGICFTVYWKWKEKEIVKHKKYALDIIHKLSIYNTEEIS